jgi:3-oxoacyl-[acyl-carrier protein] reductase
VEGTALAGRVAIVSGANHGIGEATALALAELGASVVVSYLRRAEGSGDYLAARSRDGRDVADGIEAAGGQAIAVEADLTDPAGPRLVFDRAEEALGPVSILVNNASGWRKDSFLGPTTDRLARPTEAVSAASADAQLLVDARAGALLIAELARRHRERGDGWGRIVSLTSGGPSGFPGEVSYGAAKAALENYTMSAAAELAPLGVTANVVYPPVTDTGWITPEVRQAVADSAERIVEPGEVAEVIAWLCTDAARLVTGNVIRLR